MLIRLLKLLVLSACLLPGDCSDEHETSSTVAPDPVDPTFPSPTASPPSTGVNAINCAINEENETHVAAVRIINTTTLFDYLSPPTDGNKSTCLLVLFYYPWCPFSAQAAASYNALGQLYPKIHVFALNSYQHNSINMRFGLVGIPTILFFHNGKMVAKFNNTEPTKELLFAFIKHVAGLEPDPNVNITELDWSGPVPTTVEPISDYVLTISSIFLFVSLFYLTVKSTVFKKIVESIRNTWREAEAHQHLD